MTFKWLSQTPNPPRIPVFYTLTKTHKVNLSSRPIISGCDSPTERISAFVDSLLQPIMKEQQSYIKDTTSLKERQFHKMQSLSQWMLQAYIQIHVYRKKKVSRPYAMHMTPQRAHTICLCSRLLFYSKCTGFTVCFTYSDISLTMYINQYDKKTLNYLTCGI